MSKKVLANLLLTVLALVVALLLAEAVVRMLYKDQTTLFPRYHTGYKYGRYTLRGIRPNATFHHTSIDGTWAFVTNSRGLRNTVDFPYPKPAGTLRVLSLGDSQTQGYEVRQEATYSEVLERYLRSRHVRAEVLNAGVSGFSTAEELAYLENEGYRYEPDVVVLEFYANDFLDNLRAGLFRLEAPDHLVAAKYEYVPGVRAQNIIYAIPGVKWLGENSYFYSMLFNGVWEFYKAQSRTRARSQSVKVASASKSGDGTSSSNDAANANDELTSDEIFESAVATRSEHSARLQALATQLIERMQTFATARGIRLLVVDVPVGKGPREFGPSFPAPMQRALAAAHVEVIASEPLFADFRGAVELHVPHGTHHITEFTHALIGTELGRRILPATSGPQPTAQSTTAAAEVTMP
jgi:lysophospholipase L1-like esterase